MRAGGPEPLIKKAGRVGYKRVASQVAAPLRGAGLRSALRSRVDGPRRMPPLDSIKTRLLARLAPLASLAARFALGAARTAAKTHGSTLHCVPSWLARPSTARHRGQSGCTLASSSSHVASIIMPHHHGFKRAAWRIFSRSAGEAASSAVSPSSSHATLRQRLKDSTACKPAGLSWRISRAMLALGSG